jgi:hypothetical protein
VQGVGLARNADALSMWPQASRRSSRRNAQCSCSIEGIGVEPDTHMCLHPARVHAAAPCCPAGRGAYRRRARCRGTALLVTLLAGTSRLSATPDRCRWQHPYILFFVNWCQHCSSAMEAQGRGDRSVSGGRRRQGRRTRGHKMGGVGEKPH